MPIRRKKHPRKRRSASTLIKQASTKYLETLLARAKKSKSKKITEIRALIQDELVARDLNLGGPDRNWGHG